jgi:hypothetical protein
MSFDTCLNCPLAECVSRCATPADAKKFRDPPACLIEYAAWRGVTPEQQYIMAFSTLDKDKPITARWYKRGIDRYADRNAFLNRFNLICRSRAGGRAAT